VHYLQAAVYSTARVVPVARATTATNCARARAPFVRFWFLMLTTLALLFPDILREDLTMLCTGRVSLR